MITVTHPKQVMAAQLECGRNCEWRSQLLLGSTWMPGCLFESSKVGNTRAVLENGGIGNNAPRVALPHILWVEHNQIAGLIILPPQGLPNHWKAETIQNTLESM
jgi:hypothetical protein